MQHSESQDSSSRLTKRHRRGLTIAVCHYSLKECTMLMARGARTLILVLAACLALYAVRSEAQTTLKVSAIPDESPTELQRKFVPLGKYLEAKIGMPVEFIPVTDYAATVEGLAARKLDMVWYGRV